MIKWIKKNWHDSVWSKVFAWVITGVIALILSGLWILLQTLFKQISLQESFDEFLGFIQIIVPIPMWLIILLFLATFVFILIRLLKIKKVSINVFKPVSPTIKESENIKQTIESNNIGLAKQNFNSSITSKFLGLNSGIFSIWGYVSDIHNRIHPQRRYMCIAGYATNDGNPLKNPNLAEYPNAWAIQRLTPTAEDNKGVWRFWCNNITKDLTHLDYNEPLTGGWHLFSVAWSVDNNYIKFIIDKKIVVEEKYINWPTDFSSFIMIGTWANRAGTHFFDSKIGPWRFIESKFKEDLIIEYFNKRPEE